MTLHMSMSLALVSCLLFRQVVAFCFIKELLSIQAHYKSVLREKASSKASKVKGHAKQDLHMELGREMLKSMHSKLRGVTFLTKAFCTKHDRMCPLQGSDGEAVGGKDGISIWSGGNSCLDWSSFGSKEGWAGFGTLVFMVWIMHAVSEGRPGMVKRVPCSCSSVPFGTCTCVICVTASKVGALRM